MKFNKQFFKTFGIYFIICFILWPGLDYLTAHFSGGTFVYDIRQYLWEAGSFAFILSVFFMVIDRNNKRK